jgi:hypothetical protein
MLPSRCAWDVCILARFAYVALVINGLAERIVS